MTRRPPAPVSIPAEFWGRADLGPMLAARDVAGILRAVQREYGYSQRQVAAACGIAQSEVGEIYGGRRIRSVDTLERVADGLGCPRWRMNLAAHPGAADLVRRAQPLPPQPVHHPPRPVVDRWDGALVGELRRALRLSMREFAGQLEVSDRQAWKWEAGGADCHPRLSSQRVLDGLLNRAPDDAVARFARWATSGWIMHAVLPGPTTFTDALDLAVKVAVTSGLDVDQVTVSPVAAQAHRHPVSTGWYSPGGDSDG